MDAPDLPDQTLEARLAELDGLRARGVLSDKDYELARSIAISRAGAQAPLQAKEGRSRWPWVIGAAAVLAVAAIVSVLLITTGGSDTSTPAADASPQVTTTWAPDAAPALPVYDGAAFSIGYPRGFYRETSEEDMGGYFDTTFRESGTDTTLVRVNQSPGDAVDGRTSALQLEENTSKTPGYRRISITQTTLGGMPAARWEFLTAPSGRTLRTVNILGNDGTSGWGVMTRAPDGDYARWAPIFKQVRSSFKVTG